MYKKAKAIFIYAETPTRVGSGSELGYVDLPIQRERHSGFPKIEASGLKGSIRSVFESDNELKKMVELTFGPDDGNQYAGSLGFMDGRILLFPVKSAKGIFAWITCPYVLSRFKEEMQLCSEKPDIINYDLESIKPNSVTNNTSLTLWEDKNSKGIIMLEEYKFEVKKDDVLTKVSEWFSKVIFPKDDAFKVFKEKMIRDIVVLSDDAFRDFTELSTEVITRTKIDSTKGVVKKGALFNEEYVPENTVFYSLAFASSLYGLSKEEKEKRFTNSISDEDIILQYLMKGIKKYEVIQIGGNATIGKGIVRIGPMEGVN